MERSLQGSLEIGAKDHHIKQGEWVGKRGHLL